jgi:hypothetical protein
MTPDPQDESRKLRKFSIKDLKNFSMKKDSHEANNLVLQKRHRLNYIYIYT